MLERPFIYITRSMVMVQMREQPSQLYEPRLDIVIEAPDYGDTMRRLQIQHSILRTRQRA